MDPSFFTRLGLFVRPNFLSDVECRRLQAEVQSAQTVAATVGDDSGTTYVVDEATRRTGWASVPETTFSFVQSRLEALKPALEEHFGTTLRECQRPQFLVYRSGDFFDLHRDSIDTPEAAEFSKSRRVSVIVFLNKQADGAEPGDYRGGSLTFHGMMGDRDTKIGFPVTGRPGVLIAFPANVLHEVTPVTSGERYTIASWFV